MIDASTRLVGLIGYPVEHSASPAMHNAAFAALKMNWAYVALPVYPDHLREAVFGLRALGFAGANVTVPHKQDCMRHLDETSRAADLVGAVNTIVVRDGSTLYGDNTDAYGFIASLREEGFDPSETYCAVIGAGGAARAVTYALAEHGARMITLFNRSTGRAKRLCKDMARFFTAVRFEPHPLSDLGLVGNEYDLLVNTTSIGMWPGVDSSPWPDDLPIPAHLTVCDLVYNPRETRFLSQAGRAGAVTICGLGMLLHQGVAAFRLWTGRQPPLEVMRRALEGGFSK